jgi:poly-gamma-glutamate synthesis protein (capsule biosynthesis protein)
MVPMKIAVVGDVMPSKHIIQEFLIRGPEAVRSDVWRPADGSDVILANLEAPLTAHGTPRADKKFNFQTDSRVLDLFDSRFVLSLANNHIMDFGESGLADTIESLRERGISFAGAGQTLEQASRPAIVESGAGKLGVICAADPRYQAAGRNRPGTCPARPGLIRELLQDLGQSVDYSAVSLHMGMEYVPVPTPGMLALGQQCLEAGARLVVFHHAHCLSGWTRNERGLIIWGAGNFLFNPTGDVVTRAWGDSAVWKTLLPPPGSETAAIEIEVVPIRIGGSGSPVLASAEDADRIRKTVAAWSTRISRQKTLGAYRLASVMRPDFLRVSLGNYLDMLKRVGISGVARQILSTWKLHTGKNPP